MHADAVLPWSSLIQGICNGCLLCSTVESFFQNPSIFFCCKEDRGKISVLSQRCICKALQHESYTKIEDGVCSRLGFANMDALATTISSQKATFYGRSRSSLWTKGETSKNFINVHDIFLDCDCNSIRSETCNYTSIFDHLKDLEVEGNREETNELCRTPEENEGKSRTASEMADMLYDAIVLLTQLHSKM
ncbi:hypothetical protein EZV62_018821 [Acer yangbiense]|uniref:phosphoribosyl-AMP cyclohydrolase n=1 Tax=Acer yangbiense TaxID=1000413 RepID=A0A5C7HAL8_9ROSI|nr:hypothetical protein EZV62_018821 [Acer yangbiense]